MFKRFISNRVVLNTIVLFIYILSLEFIVRGFIDSSFLDISILRIAYSSIFISLLISFITHFMHKLVARIINIIIVILLGIYYFVEFGLYNYLGFFMGISNSEQGTKVLGFVRDFLSSLSWYHWLIFIPTYIFILYYLLGDTAIMKNRKRNKNMRLLRKINIELFTILILVSMYTFYYVSLKKSWFQNPLQFDSDFSLWLYPENSNLAVNNFGVAMYGISDARSIILGIDEMSTYDNVNDTTNNKNDVVENNYTRKIDDTVWKNLNENTKDSTKKSLNSYFMSRNITPKNEMTGIFKGKNLIIILMESVNDIAILNKNDFPTLYKLYNEGISFRNNFSPRNNCSTGNNEFTVLSSLYTINHTCTANTYASNKYFEGAFNIFKNEGYYATSYHDYTQKYYFRKTIHAGLGSQKFYGVTDLGIKYDPKYEEWPSDVDMFKRAQKYYMSKDKFMSYFAAVSTHQTYNVPSVLGDKYRHDWDNVSKYNTSLKRYLSKMKVFDKAIEELLKELESTGKLDDTVIALFCDHYPYGLTDAEINAYLKENNANYRVNRNATKEKNVDRTPLIIYNSKTEAKVVEKYTSIIDLLPTLLNMFDMNYDPRLYLGTDIFSDSHPSRAYFADGSWVDEKGFYYVPTSKITYNDESDTYSKQEILAINSDISKKQKMSAKAIRTDYFKYLGEGLEKYKKLTENTEKMEE